MLLTYDALYWYLENLYINVSKLTELIRSATINLNILAHIYLYEYFNILTSQILISNFLNLCNVYIYVCIYIYIYISMLR